MWSRVHTSWFVKSMTCDISFSSALHGHLDNISEVWKTRKTTPSVGVAFDEYVRPCDLHYKWVWSKFKNLAIRILPRGRRFPKQSEFLKSVWKWKSISYFKFQRYCVVDHLTFCQELALINISIPYQSFSNIWKICRATHPVNHVQFFIEHFAIRPLSGNTLKLLTARRSENEFCVHF